MGEDISEGQLNEQNIAWQEISKCGSNLTQELGQKMLFEPSYLNEEDSATIQQWLITLRPVDVTLVHTN